jgi:hypothetical protein
MTSLQIDPFVLGCQSLNYRHYATMALRNDFEVWEQKSVDLCVHTKRRKPALTDALVLGVTPPRKGAHSSQERFFCGLNLFLLKVRPHPMHPTPRMMSMVPRSLGVLNT